MFLSTLTKSILPLSLVIGLCAAATVRAESALDEHQARHHIVNHQTNKEKTANGYTLTTIKTDDTGATATRKEEIVNDKAGGVRTRIVSGTTFEGKTYSGQSVIHKTETGYTAEDKMTRSDGTVVNRTVVATVDKTAGTVTKNISTTPEGGVTTTRTVVESLKQFHKHQHEHE